ncbi:MAG: DUF4340 domain-containing protein [Lachnospiraceae bacterium]|nr:DUF4340 domain-containing protein [Lachnospiraceae bacterium]
MKKKKRIRNLACGVLVLLALLLVMIFVKKKSEVTVTRETLTGLTVDKLKTIAYKKKGSEEVSFTRNRGLWEYNGSENFTVDQTKVGTLASSLTGNGLSRKLEDASDLEQYGLADPAYEISLTTRDGEEIVIHVGAINEMTNDVYVLLGDDSKTVYAVSAGLLTNLDKTRVDYEEAVESAAESVTESSTADNGAEEVLEAASSAAEAVTESMPAEAESVPESASSAAEAVPADGSSESAS